jgi:nucleoside-diphosphate kinase
VIKKKKNHSLLFFTHNIPNGYIIFMQKTLILLKPDCLENKVAGQVIGRFEDKGYEIKATKMLQLNDGLLRVHYAHVADLPFFPEIAGFMSSRPVLALILEGNEVIQGVRDLLGPTDSNAAPAGTIRGDLGTDRMKNVVHASDSEESAAAEINRFFKPEEIPA